MRNPRLHAGEQILGIGLMVTCAFAATSLPAVAQKPPATEQCRIAGPLARVPELPEASGLALSRRSPERLWSHNDSGGPSLIALNTPDKAGAWYHLAEAQWGAGNADEAASLAHDIILPNRGKIWTMPTPINQQPSWHF